MNSKRGFAPLILLVVIAVVAIGGAYVYTKDKSVDTVSVNTTTNTNVQASIDAKTAGWKRYDSGRGFEFKYPTNFTLDSSSTGDTIIFTYNEQGERHFVVGVDEYTYPSLEATVKAKVASLKANSAQAANPVTVSYKAAKIGGNEGYLITSQAGGALRNTDAMFMILKGSTVFSFKYSYSATNATQSSVYNQIQTIISTFKYF